MKRFVHPYCFLMLSTLLFACTSVRPGVDQAAPSTISGDCNTQEYLVAATLYTQRAAEYDALCIQAYHFAALRLKEILEQGESRPAVVLDLDETVLDNSPYQAWQIVEDRPFDSDTWAAWVADAEAEAVPGAVAFLNLADSLGAEIYYISNRRIAGLDATVKNMKALGISAVDPSRFLLKTNTSDKTSRREQVLATVGNIALLIGDNLGDFDAVWDKPASVDERSAMVLNREAQFGTVFIALPNPLYGTWLQALYGYDRSLDPAQSDAARRKQLRPWKGPE